MLICGGRAGGLVKEGDEKVFAALRDGLALVIYRI